MRIVALCLVLACAVQVSGEELGLDVLECPCAVTTFDMYLDGGTLGGRLEDQHGNVLGFCLDGRMREISSGADLEKLENEPRLFFVGAEHPTHAGARALEFGGVEELALLEVLSSWVESVVPFTEFEEVRTKYRTCRWGAERHRVAEAYQMSEEQSRALWIDSVVFGRESFLKQQEGGK